MKKRAKLKLVKTLLTAILILSIAVTIIGDGDTWTPLMALFMWGLLYGERKINANYYEGKKNARRVRPRTSSKITPFSNFDNIIPPKAREVK